MIRSYMDLGHTFEEAFDLFGSSSWNRAEVRAIVENMNSSSD